MNVSRTDHGKITGEPENRLCRSAARLTRVRNPQARPLAVIQITIILWAGTPDSAPRRAEIDDMTG